MPKDGAGGSGLGSLLGGGKKRAVVPDGGADAAVFMLDGAAVQLRLQPAHTAGDLAICVATRLGLDLDAEYGIFLFSSQPSPGGGAFCALADDVVLNDALQEHSFELADLLGGHMRRIYFKRRRYITMSELETREDEPQRESDPHFDLAFREATFHFLECTHRFPREVSLDLAALLLHINRGPSDPERDTAEALEAVVPAVVPRYLIADAPAPEAPPALAADAPMEDRQRVAAGACASSTSGATQVFHRIGTAEDQRASTRSLAGLLSKQYEKKREMSRFDAKREFLQQSKDFLAFGSEYFVAKRTWKDSEQSTSEAQVKSRTEVVTVCVGYWGLILTGMSEPLACEEYQYDTITRWTVSKDLRVFAFHVDDPGEGGVTSYVVYVVTDLAKEVEAAVERFVYVLVDKAKGTVSSSRSRGAAQAIEATALLPSLAHPGREEGLTSRWPDDDADGGAEAAGAAGGGAAGGGAATAAAGDGLPPGWEAMVDEDGDTFYYHEETGRTQWEKPAAEEASAAAGGEAAAGGDAAGEAQGDGAAGDDDLPPGWQKVTSEDGETFYYHEESGETQWDKPTAGGGEEAADAAAEGGGDELPAGWVAQQDEDGDTFYYHEETGASQWEKPTA